MKINGATAKITSALLKEFRPHQPVSSLASGSGRGVRELFARVFNDRPAYLPALHSKAFALAERGDFAAALELLDQALALNKDYWEAWLTKGMILQDMGQHEAAKVPLDRACDLELRQRGFPLSE